MIEFRILFFTLPFFLVFPVFVFPVLVLFPFFLQTLHLQVALSIVSASKLF
jgi:hypothetical protein